MRLLLAILEQIINLIFRQSNAENFSRLIFGRGEESSVQILAIESGPKNEPRFRLISEAHLNDNYVDTWRMSRKFLAHWRIELCCLRVEVP
jgi:hypothetical protein